MLDLCISDTDSVRSQPFAVLTFSVCLLFCAFGCGILPSRSALFFVLWDGDGALLYIGSVHLFKVHFKFFLFQKRSLILSSGLIFLSSESLFPFFFLVLVCVLCFNPPIQF